MGKWKGGPFPFFLAAFEEQLGWEKKGFLKLLHHQAARRRREEEEYGKDALSTSGGGPSPSYATAVGGPPTLLPKRKIFLQRRKAQDFPYFPRQAPPFSKRGFAKKEKDENSFSAMKPGGKELFLFFLGGGGRSAGIGRVKKSFPLR